MIKLEMTKDEFEILLEWSRNHFWDETESFDNNYDIDQILRFSKNCLLFARLKAEAINHDINFGYHEIYEEDDPPTKKCEITSAFLDNYQTSLQRLLDEAKSKEKQYDGN